VANLYEIPAEYVPIDTYAPLPFDDLLRAGQLRKKNEDDLISGIKVLDRDIKYAPWREQRAINLQTDIHNKVDDLANQTFQKKNFSDARKQAQTLGRKLHEDFQFGEPAKLQTEHDRWVNRQKEFNDALEANRKNPDKPGGLTPMDVRLLQEEDMDNVNPDSPYDSYNPQPFVTNPGIQTEIQKIAKEMPAWSEDKIGKWASTHGLPSDKLQSFITSVKEKKFDVMEPILTNYILNNPDWQAYLSQQARLYSRKVDPDRLTSIDPNIVDKLSRAYPELDQNSPEFQTLLAREQAKKELPFQLASTIARNAASTNIVKDVDVKRDIVTDEAESERRKNPEPSVVPYYETPSLTIKGVEYEGTFTQKEKGEFIGNALTKEEYDKLSPAEKMKRQGNYTSPDEKSFSKEKGYLQPNEIPQKKYELAKGVLSLLKDSPEYASIFNKWNNKENLTKEEADKIYPMLDEIEKQASENKMFNAQSVEFTPEERKVVNGGLFGYNSQGISKETVVKNLGTGSSGNVKFLDENGETLSLKQLKENHSEDAAVEVNGKFKAENVFPLLAGGDKSFQVPTQLFIEGKQYIVSGPEGYLDAKTKSPYNEANINYQRDKVVNAIYQAKASPIPLNMRIHGVETITGFDKKDNTFNLKIGNVNKKFNTAKEAENYIFEMKEILANSKK